MKLNDYSRVRTETVKPVSVILSEFNIENLSSGNYNLVVEARNQQNEIVASGQLFLQRSNPNAQPSFTDVTSYSSDNTFAGKITNIDTLKEYLSSTFPISSGLERSFLRTALKSSDIHYLQNYFYGFWQRREQANPEHAWLLYNEEVKKAQYNFGTRIKKGYQTDRGRVYLEYGPPNTRSVQYYGPNQYPYEIWHYYTLKETQRNKKFVFYSPDMVTSDFFLIHSDAIGEVNDPQWQFVLTSRSQTPVDIMDTQTIQTWGNLSDDYWTLPN
jgi:GWxTD domain-containing protein